MRSGTIVCKRDVGQPDFQQPVEQCLVGDVVGIKAHLYQNLCDPEIVGRGIENAVQYRRKVCTAGHHRTIPRRFS
jgi:hypothetical protein